MQPCICEAKIHGFEFAKPLMCSEKNKNSGDILTG